MLLIDISGTKQMVSIHKAVQLLFRESVRSLVILKLIIGDIFYRGEMHYAMVCTLPAWGDWVGYMRLARR